MIAPDASAGIISPRQEYAELSLLRRMLRAAQLDPQLYEEVERDISAIEQAFTVVLLAAVASGLGSALGQLFNGNVLGAIGGFLGGIIVAVVGWVLWSYVNYVVGTRMSQGRATPGELLRTLGFANTPGVLNFFSFVPGLGGLLGVVAFFWMAAGTVIAIRQALDLDTTKAVCTAAIGLIPYLILISILRALLHA